MRPGRPQSGRRRPFPGPAALVVAAGLAAPAAPLAAQTVLGDAASSWVVPRGVVKIGVAQDWGSYDEAFGAPPFDTGSARVGFGRRLTTDSLGVRQIPSLAAAQRDLRTLTGQSGFSLTLGSLTTVSTVSTRTTALDLEAGLGRGLALTVVVPVVRTLATVGANPDPVGGGANVGVSAAASAATAVRTQFETANTQLRTRYPACFTTAGGATGAAGCADVNALYTAGTGYAAALGRVYVAGGVAPLTGSAAQQAVNATVAQYNARYAALLGGASVIGDSVGGTNAAALADYQTLLTGTAAGVAGDSLRSVSRVTLGDVEVGLRLRLVDTFHGREERRLNPRGVNFRATVAGLFRAGTGHHDSPDDVVDVATGDGQNDIEVAALGDLLFGPRAWLSVAGRYGRQLADALPVRIPLADEAGAVFLPAYARQEVDRDLGDYLQIEAIPRYALGNNFAVELRYLFRSKQEDRYTGTYAIPDSVSGSSGVVLDAAQLGAGTEQRQQRVGGAIAYSTYGAYARGRARLPLEVSVSHQRTVSGRGGVPALAVTRLQVRAFPRLFGR